MSGRRVVITGLGAVTPLGNDFDTTWQNLIAGKSGVGQISLFDASEYTCTIAAEVKDFDSSHVVEPKEARRIDRFSLFALVAAHEAMKDSGLSESDYDRPRCGTILGVGIGGLQYLEDNLKTLIQNGPRRVSPFLIPAMISNLAPGHLGISHNLQGVNYTVTSACTSGTHAIGEAYRMIRDGLQDMMLSGGTEAAITSLGVAGFARMKALSTRNDEPEKASRPFDRDRDGFVMGEGSAVLVLEELEAAKKRGAPIYAEVAGYGFSCDAHHITAPPEGGEGAKLSMRGALEMAGLSPDQVQYVNAHGTSTPINDPAESAAIRDVFGAHADSLAVSSTKSMTGHLLGAAGGVEGAILAKALKSSVIPPTANLDNPGEGCDLDYVPHEAREASIEAGISNSFGFGGTNGTLLLRRV